MAWPNGNIRDVLSQIESVDLPHPSGPLLSSFVTEAVDPGFAARYLSASLRMSAGEARLVVSEWAYIVNSITESGRPPPPPDTVTRRAITRRDGGKCCITGKAGTFWDPLLVAPILLSPTGWTTGKDGILDMLNAFFGPQYRDWWLSYARNPEHMSHYCNHWLVRTSAAKVLAQGLVRLDRLQPSMVEYEVKPVLISPEDPIEVNGPYPLLGDHLQSGIEKVDPCFVGTHARLRRSIQYLKLANKIAPGILQPSEASDYHPVWHPTLHAPRWKPFSLLNLLFNVFLSVWLLFPSTIQVATYKMMRKLGECLYVKPQFGVCSVNR